MTWPTQEAVRAEAQRQWEDMMHGPPWCSLTWELREAIHSHYLLGFHRGAIYVAKSFKEGAEKMTQENTDGTEVQDVR